MTEKDLEIQELRKEVQRIRFSNAKLEEELKEYRALDEQGLLLKLPCKVGDTVYFFKTLNDGENTIILEEFKIHMFSFTNAGLFMIDNFRHSLCTDLLNETVFLTKAEAEKVLEKMRWSR